MKCFIVVALSMVCLISDQWSVLGEEPSASSSDKKISFIEFGNDMGEELQSNFDSVAIDGTLTKAKRSAQSQLDVEVDEQYSVLAVEGTPAKEVSFINFGNDMGKELQSNFDGVEIDGTLKKVKRSAQDIKIDDEFSVLVEEGTPAKEVSFINFGNDMGEELQSNFDSVAIDGTLTKVKRAAHDIKIDEQFSVLREQGPSEDISFIEFGNEMGKGLQSNFDAVAIDGTLTKVKRSAKSPLDIKLDKQFSVLAVEGTPAEDISFIKFGNDMAKELQSNFDSVAIDGTLTKVKRSAKSPLDVKIDEQFSVLAVEGTPAEDISFINFGNEMAKGLQSNFDAVAIDGTLTKVKRSA